MGSINSIESCSMVDGPGVRSVVFLNECHLRCKYCHNPEMLLKQENNIDAVTLVDKLLKNKDYFGDKGGITFSGGEPLLQTDFLLEVINLLKDESVHTVIDTAGITNQDYTKVVDLCDLLLYDVKHTKADGYKAICGGNYSKSLEFKNYISKIQKPVWIRQVVVPGIHDNKEYLLSLKDYIKDLNVQRIDFLPFSKLCLEKYEKLNIEFPLKSIEAMDKIKCEELYKEFINM